MYRFKSRPVLVRIVALVTLGSGALNLYSVIGPSLPERTTALGKIFPLEFIHLSRFSTLLIGFALVVSSINIYKRKKRAWWIVLLLACSSVIFHLTKGVDYEEATLSAILVLLLLGTRESFVVRSSIPDLRSGALRLAAAFLAALLYGVAGFWLLDRREFGINFTLADAIHRTLLFLSLIGDPGVVPHTRYARWFLSSMYLITATAIAYSLFAIFRPVVYLYRTLPRERHAAQRLAERYGRSCLDYFKFWPDKTFFFSLSQQSYVAFKVGAGYAVALGDPVGTEEEIEINIREFSEFCDQNGWRVAFYQTPPDLLPVYRRLGFRHLKIGDEALVDLTQFSLEGKQFKKLRSKVNQFEKEGIQFRQYLPPLPASVLAQAKEVSDAWLTIPGRRERTFTLGLFEERYLRSTPVHAAVAGDGSMLGFVNVIPCYRKGEATVDLMRHRPDAPPGVMDYIFARLFLAKKQEGFARFNMGMAPMSGFQEREEASIEERAVHYFMQRLNFLFNYQGLRYYKAKFATIWEPRYLIYRHVLNLPLVARAITEVSEIRD